MEKGEFVSNLSHAHHGRTFAFRYTALLETIVGISSPVPAWLNAF